MKRLFAAAGVVLAVILGFALSSGTASAVPVICSPHLVSTSHSTIKNDLDSGNHGNWATDNFVRTTKIYDNCNGTYSMDVVDSGHFTTMPPALSPNQGLPVLAKVTGTFNGSTSFLVHSRVGPTTQAPSTIVGSPSTSTWPTRFFKVGGDYGSYTMGAWKWVYNTMCESDKKLNEQWIDSSTNGDGGKPGDGDITGKAAKCKVTPPPTTTTAPPTTTTAPPTTSTTQPPATTIVVNNGGSGGSGGVVNQVASVPVGAPQTGFGGAQNADSSWLFAGIGSLLAALGLLGFALFTKRGTRVTS